jgi:sugar/nucleoside kinase (ribokinase family)
MEPKNSYYDLAIIGNYTRDKIVSPTGTRYVDGGGFNYGVHVALMMGLKVAAITRLAEEDHHVVESLLKMGADVYPYYSPKSTYMFLYYPTKDVDNRELSVTSLADPFRPEHVQALRAKAFLINASTRGEVDITVLEELQKKTTIVAADVQGFVRTVDEQGIVLTHRDGLLVYADKQFYEAPFLPAKLIGRSGRGDTCIGAYTAKRLSSSPAESTIWAAAVTSLKMEAEGPIKRKVEEVEKMIKEKYSRP